MLSLADLYASPIGDYLNAPRRRPRAAAPLSLADLYQGVAVPEYPAPPTLAGSFEDLPEEERRGASRQGWLAIAAALGHATNGNLGEALAQGALGQQAAKEDAVKGYRQEQRQDYETALQGAEVAQRNRALALDEARRRQASEGALATYQAIADQVGDKDPALLARARTAAKLGDVEGLQKLLALAPTRMAELSHGVAPDDPIAAEQAAQARALAGKVTERQTLDPIERESKVAQETALNPILAARAGAESQAKLPAELAATRARVAAEVASRPPQLHLDTTTGMVVDLTNGSQRAIPGFVPHGSELTENAFQSRVASEADDLYRAYERDTVPQRELWAANKAGFDQWKKAHPNGRGWFGSAPPPDPGPPPPTSAQNRARADADAAAKYQGVPRRGLPRPAGGAALPPGAPAAPGARVVGAPAPSAPAAPKGSPALRAELKKRLLAKGVPPSMITDAMIDDVLKLSGGQ